MEGKYKEYGIYRITNTVTGKTYIGKTGNNFGDRWDCHKAQLNGGYHDNKSLQDDWNLYGSDAFEFDIVCISDDTSTLDELERKYIREYRKTTECYNILDGGTGKTDGRHLSENARKLIGQKNKINMTGRKASEKTRQKMSESQKMRYARMSEDDRAKFGKKMSECARNYKWSDEAKARFSELQRTKPNGAKLTVDTVREIRRLHEEDGLSSIEIGERLGISRHTVYGIVTYKRWKNI